MPFFATFDLYANVPPLQCEFDKIKYSGTA